MQRHVGIPSLALITVALSLTACSGSTGESETASDTNDTSDTAGDCSSPQDVSGNIEADTEWSCDVVLSGIITVQNNAVLTVKPGVTVYGKSGSALVISQGSRMEAVGTAEEPIVFTSSQAEGTRNRGDWGGVVFLGNSYTNLDGGTGLAEGLENNATYGGGASPDNAYSCGTLKYVRVEFAGFELTTDNELNGITFYSCGTGTTVDHVQVHMGDDDGIEAFGGSFNMTHLVITGAADDSIDLDQGFAGMIQWVFIQHDPADGNYVFEISDQDVNLDALPRTKPKIANVTAIGGMGPKDAGIKLKEGGAGEFYNMIITGTNNAQVDLTETVTEGLADAGEIVIKNNIFWDNGKSGTVWQVSEGSSWDLQGFVENTTNGNIFDQDPMLTATTWGSPNIAPRAGSPALTGTAAPGFEATDYLGAVKDEASDWTLGWTNYAPN
ncbi:MAG: hypothetical protein R3B09_03995 [Nannocystaceae bacterium]